MSRRNSGLNFRKRKAKLTGNHVAEFFRYVFGILAAVLLALFLVVNWGMKTSVIGAGMEPALYNGQTVFISKLAYLVNKPKYGDIIVFLPNGNKYTHYYIKRVVGLPGDRIQFLNGRLLINGLPEEEGEYDKVEDPGIAENEILLGTDEYFVLGDNRNTGEDSRSGNIGPVNKSLIEGRVWFKLTKDESIAGFVKRGIESK